jgi:hypothetical protein
LSYSKRFERDFLSRSALFVQKHANLSPIASRQLLRKSRIAVLAGPDALITGNGQHALLAATNLVSRLFWNVELILPSKSKRLVHSSLVSEVDIDRCLCELVGAINPFSNFRMGRRLGSSAFDAALVVGDSEVNLQHTIRISSDGWIGYVSPDAVEPFSKANTNPIGALLAASLGACEIFKVLAKPKENATSITFSAFDYRQDASGANPELQKRLNLGILHLIGAGAIGSCLGYALDPLVPQTRGIVKAIDAERLDFSNLNRYMLAMYREADSRLRKVTSVGKIARGDLYVTEEPYRFQVFCEKEPEDMETAVVGVDDIQTRWDVQKTFPRLILNGASELDFVSVSRHSIDSIAEKACLGCLNPRNGVLPPSKFLPTISFVPGFLGAILAGEIIKDVTPEFRGYSVAVELSASLGTFPNTLSLRATEKSLKCGIDCRDLFSVSTPREIRQGESMDHGKLHWR